MRSETVSTKLDRIAEQAVQNPEMQFTTLAHLIDEEFLREAFGYIKKKAAAGVDGVTAKEYAQALDANIADLLSAHAIRTLRSTTGEACMAREG